jgi:hypothetical protein
MTQMAYQSIRKTCRLKSIVVDPNKIQCERKRPAGAQGQWRTGRKGSKMRIRCCQNFRQAKKTTTKNISKNAFGGRLETVFSLFFSIDPDFRFFILMSLPWTDFRTVKLLSRLFDSKRDEPHDQIIHSQLFDSRRTSGYSRRCIEFEAKICWSLTRQPCKKEESRNQ